MDSFIVDEWLRYAGNDLETVRILSRHHPMQVEIICYHCQQAAEKALKAYLLFNDIEPPRTHSLENLVDLCREISDEYNDIVTECEYLNPFGVQPRYPFGLELSESDAIVSIEKCERIFEFIKRKISVKGCLPMFDIKPYENMMKLDLPDAERAWISARAGALTDSFAALDAIDTTGIDPLVTVLDIQNVLREDISVKMLPREELLSGAPEQYDGYFRVPKTLN